MTDDTNNATLEANEPATVTEVEVNSSEVTESESSGQNG